MKTQTFSVSGMACGHCKARVEAALNALNGVSQAAASVEQKSVTVSYDEAVLAPAQLQAAVEAAGYHMQLD